MHKLQSVFIVLTLIFFLTACGPAAATPAQPAGPTPTKTPTPTVACPPMGQNIIATVGPSDNSSIEIDKNTYTMYDSGSTYWCKPEELSIKTVPVLTVSACKIAHANCLGEVDLKPDNVKIINPVGTVSTPPVLSYDFSAHATPTQHPETCKGIECYAFYRLNNTTWVFAGFAKGVNIPPKWFAQGNINHFSLYALVELPPARPLNPPRNLVMAVASDFLSDEAGGMGVSLQVINDDKNQLPQSDVILFHFRRIDLGQSLGTVPKECFDGRLMPDLFSCLFPIGTKVNVRLGINQRQNLHEFMLLDNSYGQDFFASPVEIFY